ncbi:hypothetical protein F0562_025787 [Nyssa sinensis]|uniref:Uncharacterized protein n=1 Tax=Nyssa sinensis TaxID=561372 RepID=A0A5J5B794_9ASTE|nr:hypothetical protein F0562_025787 [Nyssa sinensis]
MDETHLLSPDSTVADNNKSKKKKKKKKKITQSRSKAKRYALITFEELPEYMKDNEYILNYYRANWPLKEALFSIVRWHNETLNVWTHLIGYVLFLGLTVANLMHMPQGRDFLVMFIRSFPMTADTNVSPNSKDIFLETTKVNRFEADNVTRNGDSIAGNSRCTVAILYLLSWLYVLPPLK